MRYRQLILYRAVLDGDWFATMFIGVRARETITKQGDTALHVAVAANRTRFVKSLVECYMNSEDLAIQNFVGNTALHECRIIWQFGTCRIHDSEE